MVKDSVRTQSETVEDCPTGYLVLEFGNKLTLLGAAISKFSFLRKKGECKKRAEGKECSGHRTAVILSPRAPLYLTVPIRRAEPKHLPS